MPAINDDTMTDRQRARGELRPLFDAVLQFASDTPADAAIPADGCDGACIGSGEGTVTGDRLRGTMTWTLYAGDCLYPRIRRGEAVPDDLHRCTLTFGGFIDTHDGVRIRIDGRGYGLRSAVRYLLSTTLAFQADAPQYDWLTKILAVMEGDLDEKAGRAVWRVFAPDLITA